VAGLSLSLSEVPAPLEALDVVEISCASVESSVNPTGPVAEPAPEVREAPVEELIEAYRAEFEDAIGTTRADPEPGVAPQKTFPPAPPIRRHYDWGDRAGPKRESAVTSAVPTLNPPPDYPAAARRRGIEGRVVIEVTVGTDGAPTAVRIAESSGHRELDEAAAEAVWSWRFLPARRGSAPVESTQTIPFRFEIRD
jgi:protein TonB